MLFIQFVKANIHKIFDPKKFFIKKVEKIKERIEDLNPVSIRTPVSKTSV